MSLVLTAPVHRPTVIDLTTDSPPPSPSPSRSLPPRSLLSLPLPRQSSPNKRVDLVADVKEPSPKRRRLDDEETRRQRLKTSLQEHVLPHVSRAVQRLPVDLYRVNDIGIQAVAILGKNGDFRSRLEHANGFLLPKDDVETAARADKVVQQLAALLRFQITATRPTNGVPETEKTESNEAASTSNAIIPSQLPTPTSQCCTSSTPLRATYFQRRTRKLLRTKSSNPETPAPANKWFQLQQRPYLAAAERRRIVRGAKHSLPVIPNAIQQPTIYHVDFTADEVSQIMGYLSKYLPLPQNIPNALEALARLCSTHHVPSIVGDQIRGRTAEDLRNFCSDLLAEQAAPLENSCILSLEQDTDDQRGKARRISRLNSLLLAREMNGHAGFGRMRRYENFQNEFRKTLEDDLCKIAEFTNCAGDISTMSWIPGQNVICGTTTHSDTHNQQYNKQGNLLLCSSSKRTLRAFPDHRIPRPCVADGENSTEAMRQSQDPWLYSSVVSSDYDEIHDRAYTSSFDNTVKVWKVERTGQTMEAIATWRLGGNVNFVAAAKDGSGRVAAAADVPTEAVRVYTVNEDNVSESLFQSFSCSRTDADGSDKWAYFPATMQWGKGPGTRHLLVVGYSPRSLTNDDLDIPEDKRDSGEITLWDANQGRRIPVLTATTANVFEVMWHPDGARFIVATSPCGLNVKHGVRTQVHLFQRDSDRLDGAYSEYQSLDCPALDINELTFMPNSLMHAYVTAGCTDGKVYVWDTSQGDRPIHVLSHGHPIDDFHEDREKEDTGVKFTAWGVSPDRFYTGSSDGVVNVWNIRNRWKPFVRKLLEAPAPISCGVFSPDTSKLAVGDASGRVFLFSVDVPEEQPEAQVKALSARGPASRRQQQPFIPHAEPPPPTTNENDVSDMSIGEFARRTYLESKKLVLHSSTVIGAVQGPEYATTGLFLREAYLDGDPAGPLLAYFERDQQESQAASRGSRSRSFRRLGDVQMTAADEDAVGAMHKANWGLDLHLHEMADEDVRRLIEIQAELTIDDDWHEFEYEDNVPDGPHGPEGVSYQGEL